MSIPQNTGEFVRAFQAYLDCFVVVGGTPTVLYLAEREGKTSRATEDLDIVLLDLADDKRQTEFIERFKKYVADNGYEQKVLSSGKAQAYRFTNPKTPAAPKILEIASRRLEGIPASQPTQRLEEFEMSAMICEPYFVELLKAHTEQLRISDDLTLPVPKPVLLIALKAYAALNLEKSENQNDRKKYRKHLNDIARLARVLTDEDRLALPPKAFAHLEELLAGKARHFDVTRLDSCGWKGKGTSEKFEQQLRSKIVAG